MTEEEARNEKMNKALKVWALRHVIRPRDFESAMGWSYNHAWRVLKGIDPFTPSAYGQFILAYGMEGLNELFKIAGLDMTGGNHAR